MDRGSKKVIKVFLFVIFLLLLLGGGLLYLRKSGFLNKAGKLEDAFEADVAIFKSDDLAMKNKLIYGENPAVGGLGGPSLMGFFLKKANYSFIGSDKDHIEVEVSSKDMSGFLDSLIDNIGDIEEDEDILNLVEVYYPKQKDFKKLVKLPYKKGESGSYLIDYSNMDFKDAIYGGFLSSYLDFRDNFIKELSEEDEGDE